LLRIWSIVEKECPDWQLAIFGDGDRIVYEKVKNELGIGSESCLLNGRTSNVLQEYLNSSIAVCSSRFEGFGMSIVEAMACGLPVVSFDCPWGPRSIISNGEDGLLVENGNVKKLSEAMVWMIQHSAERKAMAVKAVENVQRFRIEQIAERWKSLFEAL
jgi:glycosyltransferase involved in cell wall biosynthesis